MILALQESYLSLGDQRNIHIQLTRNKRRLKRGCKQKRKGTKTLLERVTHVFNTGTLNDYTHPKEIDPFWDILYRQYEFLVYIELVYKNSIKKCNVSLSDKEILCIIQDLEYIKTHKRLLLQYLMNFMNVMYGSVIQRRFYGWKYYIEDFVSKFNEVAILNLTKLKFDADQTRCSVYFYQAFWLSGLSITNKISDDIKKNANNEYTNSNNKLSDFDDDIDALYDVYGSEIIDSFSTIEFGEVECCNGTEVIEEVIEEVEIKSVTTEEIIEEITECAALEKHEEKELLHSSEDTDFEIYCTIKHLLHQLGINYKAIHTFSDKRLAKLGKVIRKKIATGELVLHDKEKQLLANFFSSSLLR